MKNYLAFVGTPATYGTPNPRTGEFSFHGSLYCFKTKKERDEFCDTFHQGFNSYPKPCNSKTARQYFMGMSLTQYQETLKALTSGYIVSM